VIAEKDDPKSPCIEREGGRPDQKIVICGGMLLTMVEGEPPIENATIVVRGDRIVEIAEGRCSGVHGGELIDAGRCLVMPGLVNAHGHTAMTLFRGFADDLPLKEWLFTKIFPAESSFLNPDSVYWGALLGCVEMIASGTTTVSDGYFYQDSTAQAFQRAGLRALLAQGVIDFPAPGVPDPKENLTAGRAFMEKWSGASDLIRPGLFCHSLSTCSEATMRGAMQLSEKFDSPLQIHLSETEGEVMEIATRTGKRPVFYLDSLHLMTERLIAVHGVHLSDEEMDIIGRRGVGVVHCPESNMKLASGVARVQRMIELGISVAIGTDGAASNNNLDLFREMDAAAKLGKVYALDPTCTGAAVVLKMATRWGAGILGLEKEIGTIEVGKKADIIVVDLQRPHMVPLYHPMSTLVYSANGGDVKDVIVNGKILMKDRRILHLDTEEIMWKVRELSNAISIG